VEQLSSSRCWDKPRKRLSHQLVTWPIFEPSINVKVTNARMSICSLILSMLTTRYLVLQWLNIKQLIYLVRETGRKELLPLWFSSGFTTSWWQRTSPATVYGLDGRGSIPDRGKIFLFPATLRPTLGSTQPPIQWVWGGVLHPGIKRPGRETDHSLPSSTVPKAELYLHFPKFSWRGA
jgi:hypothetical protein